MLIQYIQGNYALWSHPEAQQNLSSNYSEYAQPQRAKDPRGVLISRTVVYADQVAGACVWPISWDR